MCVLLVSCLGGGIDRCAQVYAYERRPGCRDGTGGVVGGVGGVIGGGLKDIRPWDRCFAGEGMARMGTALGTALEAAMAWPTKGCCSPETDRS